MEVPVTGCSCRACLYARAEEQRKLAIELRAQNPAAIGFPVRKHTGVPGPSDDPHYDMTKSAMAGWIQTYTCDKVFPLALTPEQIELEDIAHALSMKVRFTGHCNRFYSIAEHSVRVMWECYNYVQGNHHGNLLLRAALMHDAAEYVLPDVASPIKPYLPGFKALEHRIEQVIAKRFNLVFPWPKDVKRADNALVQTERRQLMKPNPHPWDIPGEPSAQTLGCWDQPTAERMFLAAAAELGIR